MGFLDYFRRTPKSAAIAKDRLSIIVARERTATRGGGNGSDYLPQLQQELLQPAPRADDRKNGSEGSASPNPQERRR